MQVEAFLARYPPFDSLALEEIGRVARSVQIEFFPAGTTILKQAGEPARFLYVVRAGAVELLDDHLGHCVREAIASGGPEADAKVAEASAAIARLVRS